MSDAASLPSEPLPSREALKASVAKMFQDIGAANLTRRVLTKLLTQQYNLNFEPHKKLLDELVVETMQAPELQKEVAKAAKKVQSGPSRGTKEKKTKGGKDAKEKKSKREKEEGEPARAQSAYFIFANDKRPALMAEMRNDGGKVDVAVIGKKIGDMWNAMSAEEKAPYDSLAAKDKKRYEDEKAAWIAGGGGGKKEKAKAEKKDGPKRPMNAHFMYVNANRDSYKAEHPEAKLGDITKALSDRYKALSDAERQVWIDKSEADKKRYEAEVAAAKA